MKHKLSPEALGTLAALHHKQHLKFFSSDSADELTSAGFAQKDEDGLKITRDGIAAGETVYIASEKNRN